MNIREIVDKFGGQTVLARLVGINQSAVAYWVKKDAIPAKWHSQLLSIAIDKGITLEAADLTPRTVSTQQKTTISVACDDVSIPDAVVEGGVAPFDAELQNSSPFMFYASPNGAIKVQVLAQNETVWATQQGIADIFDTTKQNVSYHLSNVFNELELNQKSVVKEILTTAADGKRYMTAFYSLDAIISVGYRINSHRATQFRIWATSVLKEYMIKGYALDDDRLKQGKSLFGKDYFDDLLEKIREIRASERRFYQKITDIYSQCSIDYDSNSPATKKFYAHVQNKLHYAIHGHTSAELICQRADADKPTMGLTSWENQKVGGKIMKSDTKIGKNYLSESEISDLNRLVNMYLDFAENMARRQKTMTMADWTKKLNEFLEFNEYPVLENFGTVSRDDADRHAATEYEKFRVVQDMEYRSDFDKIVEEIKITKRLPKNS
jgi:hypothetical protein